MKWVKRIVVVLLIALFGAVGVSFLSPIFEGGGKPNYKLQLETVKGAIMAFKAECRRYPSNEEGLSVLFDMPHANCQYHQQQHPPHLNHETRDYWGHAIIYEHVGNGFTLLSLGQDNKTGGMGPNADLLYHSDRNSYEFREE